MKDSNDTIGDRTRYIPAFSAVPQPTAPPRAPNWNDNLILNLANIVRMYIEERKYTDIF
jgi:hypothetical protein